MPFVIEPQMAALHGGEEDSPALRMVLVRGHWYVPESECRRYEAHLRGGLPGRAPIGDSDPLIPLRQVARRVGVTTRTLLRRFPPAIREAAKTNDDARLVTERMAAARAARGAKTSTAALA
jgi:hypothetical protein